MGVVYLVEDTKLGRAVARKFLPVHLLSDTDIRKRFEGEAKAYAILDHVPSMRLTETLVVSVSRLWRESRIVASALENCTRNRRLRAFSLLIFPGRARSVWLPPAPHGLPAAS